MMDETGNTSDRTPDYALALLIALERRRTELTDRGQRWATEAVAALARLEETTTKCLENDYAAAAQLQIEMQRDLLDCMPDPTRLPYEGDTPELNPQEPERVRDDIVATTRFIEWLLFRKCGVPAEEIAGIFDWTSLSQQTVAYGHLLQVVENDAKSILKAKPMPERGKPSEQDRESGPPTHLRLV